MTRDQTADEDDPFRAREHHPDGTVCSRCGSVVTGQRWTVNPQLSDLLISADTPHQVECPACRKAVERLPQGIVKLRGDYWTRHRDEITNLIRNEAEEARGDNPLERVLSIREEGGCLIVETTNEKLAQKIGRSVEKAHKGHIKYQWGDRNHLVRVEWERNI